MNLSRTFVLSFHFFIFSQRPGRKRSSLDLFMSNSLQPYQITVSNSVVAIFQYIQNFQWPFRRLDSSRVRTNDLLSTGVDKPQEPCSSWFFPPASLMWHSYSFPFCHSGFFGGFFFLYCASCLFPWVAWNFSLPLTLSQGWGIYLWLQNVM